MTSYWMTGNTMRRLLQVGVLAVLWLGSAVSITAVERGFIEKFCVAPPHGDLCPTLPFDQADFDRNFEYMLIVKGAQDPFDVFSWQAFVALNWPAGVTGEPMDLRIGEAAAAPRVWQAFHPRDAIFGLGRARTACGGKAGSGHLLIGDLAQADGTTLVDQSGGFVV